MKRSPAQVAAADRRRAHTLQKQIEIRRRYQWMMRAGYDKKTACRYIGISHATLTKALKATIP